MDTLNDITQLTSKNEIYINNFSGKHTWVDQIWTHLSNDPLAKYFPSGLNATL